MATTVRLLRQTDQIVEDSYRRKKFEKLMEYLHLNNSTTNPARGKEGHDKLHHVRPILDKVSETIRACYTLHRDFAIDEAMVAFRGRLGFKQYMPAKPTKFGIKVWERADSTNGYVDKIDVYTGRSGNKDGAPEVGLASRVVLDLTRDIVGSYRHLYCDNFFTNPQLFLKLLHDGLYACGTCRKNRKGLPELPGEASTQKGDFIMMQSDKMVATVWHDNKPVLFLSTNSDPTKLDEVHRKKKDGTDRVHLAPEVVNKYSSNMNAVDRADQLRTQYSIARKSVKWWKYLFYFLVDTAITNSYILMKESPNHQLKTKRGKSKPRSQLDFRQQLCLQLIGDVRVSRKRKRFEHQDNAGNDHWPKKMKGNRCRQCAKTKIRKESSYGCGKCGVNLCVTCFEPYHREQVLLLEDEAEVQREKEFVSALKVQSWFKGSRTRSYIKHLNDSATVIQKRWRGFIGRRFYRILVKNSVLIMKLNHYNAKATKIQKIWRGYYIRKYVFNYYSRKRYLEALQIKNEIVRSELEDYAEQQEQILLRKEEAVKAKEQELLARKHHYLISTEVIPGIYNSPFLPYPSEKEYLLRSVKPLSYKSRSQEDDPYDPTCKSYSLPKPKQLPPLVKKPQGPFREPSDVQKQRYKPFQPTLRVATSFTSLEEARQAMKAEEWVTRLNDDIFEPFTRREVKYEPMLHTTSKYGHLSFGTKYFREEFLDKHIVSKPHHIQPPLVMDESFKTLVPSIPIFEKLNDTYSQGQV